MDAAVLERESTSTGEAVWSEPSRPPRVRRRRWRRWLFVLSIFLLAGIAGSFILRPVQVDAATPEQKLLAETISSSGIVQGHAEALVTAQVPGIVVDLFVHEGQQVQQGQLLARVQDNVANQQVQQALAAVASATAALAQASQGPLPTEILSATARAQQAMMAVEEAKSAAARTRISVNSAARSVSQAEAQVLQAEALHLQSVSRLSLATKNLERKRILVEEGALPGVSLDEARSVFEVAQADEIAATKSIETARIGIAMARDAQRAAEQETAGADLRVLAARASAKAAASDVKTLAAQPRQQTVAISRQRVREAEEAHQAAKLQALNTGVYAPFDGTIATVLAYPGSSSSAGILRLVGTKRLEVKVDLDEADIAKVRVGQRVLMSSPDGDVSGRVTRIASQIDSLRGTLEVYVQATGGSVKLTPGQTLNVNLVVNEGVRRLLIPSTAIQREGDQTIVYLAKRGYAKATLVQLGAVSGDNVSVLHGLAPTDLVIKNAVGLTPDTRIRVRRL